jgi:simple sugar transport system permease protein
VAINILGSAATVALTYQLTGGRGGGRDLVPALMPTVGLPRDVLGEGLYTVIGAQNIMTWVAFGAVGLIAFVLYRTPFGAHLRAVGENPEAAASVGINVRGVRYTALALSGLLAGLGGIHLSMGYLSGFTRDMTAGRGYIALVTPALGGGTPLGTMAAAALFGAFAAVETRIDSAAIPSQLPQMIPYAAVLGALILYSVRRRQREARRIRAFVRKL